MADLKELTRKFIAEVWNQGKLDLLEELVAPDCITHDPAAPGRVIRGLIHRSAIGNPPLTQRFRVHPCT